MKNQTVSRVKHGCSVLAVFGAALIIGGISGLTLGIGVPWIFRRFSKRNRLN